MAAGRRFERTLQVAVVVLAAIGALRATSRIFSLLFLPAGFWDAFYQSRGLSDIADSRYALHAGAVFAHALPALVFVLLGPWQFVRRVRARWLWLHRWSGRVFVATGAILALAGIVLGFTTALGYGGVTETSAAIAMSTVLLVCLGKAVMHVRNHRIAQHREWMIRAFAAGLTAGTVPLIGIVFALDPVVLHAPRIFTGVFFWMAITINLIVAELWIRYTRAPERPRQLHRFHPVEVVTDEQHQAPKTHVDAAAP